LRGSVDRIEDNNIAVIVWDSNSIENIENTLGLTSGDRVIKSRGEIRKVDNSKEKQEVINLQNRILRGDK